MIMRLSPKLCTKIKAGKLSEMPLDKNPFADWSATYSLWIEPSTSS